MLNHLKNVELQHCQHRKMWIQRWKDVAEKSNVHWIYVLQTLEFYVCSTHRQCKFYI